MLRVLHLLSGTPDFHAEHTAAALGQHAGSEFSITPRTIGKAGDYCNWVSALLALRGNQAQQFDVIHAFDFPALKASVRTGKVLFSPGPLPDRRSIRWLQTHMQSVPVEVACGSAAEQRVYAEHGIASEICHVIQPGIELSSRNEMRNGELRAELGFSAGDLVFLIPGESDRRSGHHEALWTVSILHVLDPHCRALIWGPGNAADAFERFPRKLHQPNLLTIAERKLGRRVEFEELPPAADIALFAPRGPTSLLPLALCMAAGLPIVSTASQWAGDLLQDGRDAVLVPRASPRLLAQRIVELRSDPALAASIAAAAKEQANRLFPVEPAIGQYHALYRKIMARATGHSTAAG